MHRPVSVSPLSHTLNAGSAQRLRVLCVSVGGHRTAQLWMPVDYVPSKTYRLMISLHGCWYAVCWMHRCAALYIFTGILRFLFVLSGRDDCKKCIFASCLPCWAQRLLLFYSIRWSSWSPLCQLYIIFLLSSVWYSEIWTRSCMECGSLLSVAKDWRRGSHVTMDLVYALSLPVHWSTSNIFIWHVQWRNADPAHVLQTPTTFQSLCR